MQIDGVFIILRNLIIYRILWGNIPLTNLVSFFGGGENRGQDYEDHLYADGRGNRINESGIRAAAFRSRPLFLYKKRKRGILP